MSDEEKIIRCPICEKIVMLERGWKKEKIHPVNGISIGEVVFSKGGWGRAQSMAYKFSGEVCLECFNIIKTKIDELSKILEERQGCHKQGIYIYGASDNKTEGYQVPDLQSDELQPKRHKISLLRLLPRFSR